MVKTTIIIVTWNSQEHIGALLAGLPPDPSYEIIVVDNASSDQTVRIVEKTFPHVTLIKNPRNEFLSRATNQAARIARGQYLLLLNPDIVIRPESIERMARYLDDNVNVGALGPQLRYPDGRIQHSCREFPTCGNILLEFTLLPRLFKSLSRWKMGYFDHKTSREVDQPMGSCLMVKREVLVKVGMMDEAFPLFCNDVILCQKIRQAGYVNYFLSEVSCTHLHGGSTRQARARMIIESSHSLYRYLKNRYRTGLPLYACGMLIWASMVLRVLACRLGSIFSKPGPARARVAI
jgi:GT2 family glycosyltransferase